MRSMIAFGFAVVLGLVLGCGQQATTPAADTAPDQTAAVPAADQPVTVEMVEVAPAGSEFDPPVEVSQLPDGAWYCDMGTVHYARMEEGDGRCARCGMTLTHKVAAAAASDEPASGDEPSGDGGHDEGGEHHG